MSNWAVVKESDNICDNVVVWDGVSQWSPPAGHYVKELSPDSHAGIGWKWDAAADQWVDVRPPVEPVAPMGGE